MTIALNIFVALTLVGLAVVLAIGFYLSKDGEGFRKESGHSNTYRPLEK